jgi:hypothetical protein
MQAFGCQLCAISLRTSGSNRCEQMTSRVSFSPPLVRHVGPLLLFFMLVSTTSLLAQQTAALSGMLTDSSKYPIEGASVTLRNTGSNEIRRSLTDASGRYTLRCFRREPLRWPETRQASKKARARESTLRWVNPPLLICS